MADVARATDASVVYGDDEFDYIRVVGPYGVRHFRVRYARPGYSVDAFTDRWVHVLTVEDSDEGRVDAALVAYRTIGGT